MENQAPEYKPTTKNTKRWPKVLAITLACLAIFLWILPELVRLGAQRWLNQQPQIQQLSIEDIDINLFSGEVALKGVRLTGAHLGEAQLEAIYINLGMQQLFSKNIDVQQLSIIGLEFNISTDGAEQYTLAGIPLPQAAAPATPPPATLDEPLPDASADSSWGVGIQALELQRIAVHIEHPELQTDIRLQSLQLGRAATWLPAQQTPIKLSMQLAEAQLQLKGQLTPFEDNPAAKLHLNLQNLPLSLADKMAAAQGVKGLDGLLNLEIDATASASGAAHAETTLSLDGLKFDYQNYAIALEQLNWQGPLAYTRPESETDLGARVDGALKLSKLQVYDQAAQLSLLDLDALAAKQISLQAQQLVSITELKLSELTTLSNKEGRLFSTQALILQAIAYDGRQELSIDTITFNKARANIELEKSGALRRVSQLTSAPPQESEPEADPTSGNEGKTADAAKPLRIAIRQFALSEQSGLQFTDNTVQPPYSANIQPLQLTISDIDTANIKQDIQIELVATINGLAKLNTRASVQPFGKKINMSAQGKLSGLDLPPLSPYAMQAMGYYIRRGQANAKFSAIIKDDMLESDIKLKLNKFNIEAGDPEKVKTMNESLSMPFDLALDILRDKNDNIEMELNIEGDIKDPQFDANKVITKAVGKATKFAAFYVLGQSLQPWGTVYTIAGFLGKKITTPSFEPVLFTAGSAEITDEHQEYMGKMATLLKERPELQLNICALPSEQDRLALSPAPATDGKEQAEEPQETSAEPQVSNQTLLDLAQNRMAVIRQLLMDQGIPNTRLFTCQPNIEDLEDEPPGVELYL